MLKFHGLFAAEELQPFPEEWYQHGYIEGQQPVTADSTLFEQRSYDEEQSDNSWVPRWEDDRMGMMEHPTRGTGKEKTIVNLLMV